MDVMSFELYDIRGYLYKKGLQMDFLQTAAALTIIRCDSYLKNHGIMESLDNYPSLQSIVLELSEDDLKIWLTSSADNQKAAGKSKGDFQQKRYFMALSMLGDNTVMRSLLDLSITLFTFPEFGAYLTEHFGYSVTLHLAYLLEGIDFPSQQNILASIEGAKKLLYIAKDASPVQYAELCFDERAMGYLFGDDSLSPLLSDFTVAFSYVADGKKLHDLFLYKDLVSEGTSFFKKGGSILQLSSKGGRRFLSKHIAKGIKKDFLFLNLSDFLRDAGKQRFEELKEALIREACFDESGICFYGITESFLMDGRSRDSSMLSRDLEVMERILFTPITNAGIPLILCADTTRPLIQNPSPGKFRLLRLNPSPGYEDRKVLWEGFSKLYGLLLDPDSFAMRYHLCASEISSVISIFRDSIPDIKKIGKDEEALFTKIVTEQFEKENESGVGRIIYSDLRLNDVKIKDSLRAVLDDVVASIQKSGLILDEWGLRKNYPYGRSVSLLMTGPPGTGKTMTANALSGELGLPLYQVNLANVVDKYIGETEKNLEKAFAFAEKTNSVLFFDEADSLFSTRTEVHDSKDRYANNEISYLLQRIEAFDGIVIMATNIKTNIDAAFLRRIRYVIHYENPDEALRKEIWKGCLTDSIPHEEIDFDYLASQFDTFTGSIIKTVFLNACAYAAGKGDKLSMSHLVHALRQELEKTSTVAFSHDALGKYAYLQ